MKSDSLRQPKQRRAVEEPGEDQQDYLRPGHRAQHFHPLHLVLALALTHVPRALRGLVLENAVLPQIAQDVPLLFAREEAYVRRGARHDEEEPDAAEDGEEALLVGMSMVRVEWL